MIINEFTHQIIKDDYSRTFKDLEELSLFVNELSGNDEWITVNSDDISAEVVPDMPLFYPSSGTDYSLLFGHNVQVESSMSAVEDTAKQTKLGLCVDGEKNQVCYLLGTTGINTLALRAGVAAPGPAKVYDNNRSEYKQILNFCFKYQHKRIKLLLRGEKIRAAVSDCGGKGYSILPQNELLETLRTNLDRDFPGNMMTIGHWSHDLLHAEWTLEQQAEALLNDYKDALALRAPHYNFTNYIPVVVFSTSDTTDAAACVTARLRDPSSNHSITIGPAMRVVHKHNRSVSDFCKETSAIFSRYTERLGDLMALLDIHISYPENALRNVMQSYRLKRTHVEKAANALAGLYAPGHCTAHDLYIAMNEVLYDIEQEDIRKADDYSECISRALHLKQEAWKEFDVDYVIGSSR